MNPSHILRCQLGGSVRQRGLRGTEWCRNDDVMHILLCTWAAAEDRYTASSPSYVYLLLQATFNGANGRAVLTRFVWMIGRLKMSLWAWESSLIGRWLIFFPPKTKAKQNSKEKNVRAADNREKSQLHALLDKMHLSLGIGSIIHTRYLVFSFTIKILLEYHQILPPVQLWNISCLPFFLSYILISF